MPDRDDERLDDAELAELADLVQRARLDEAGWEPPPEALWDRIAAAIDAEDRGELRADHPVAPAPEVSPFPPPSTPDVDAEATGLPASNVVPLGRARRRSRWLGLAAAAAVVVIAATAALALNRDGDDSRVVSAVDLERLAGSGSGRAELVDADGTLQIRLETDELDAGDGYLELWLIDPSVTRLVSLGPLRPDGVYDVPAGVDPAEFPIVDISVEPVDGDPTHSGDSLLRGELSL
jgi:hypothetical protein